MFKGPARAITRNALVVAIGFLPLLVAPLIPYRTVGFFMFMIMLTASIGTLLILPAIITGFPSIVFEEKKKGITCSCGKCVLMSLIIAASVIYVLLGYNITRWNVATVAAVIVVVLLSGVCSFISRRKACLNTGDKDTEV